jgi:hypothetical protein
MFIPVNGFQSIGAQRKATGREKPRQYGPLSYVQYSVARNAERIGIDPASIVGYWPFWEGAGAPYDVMSGTRATAIGSGNTWTGKKQIEVTQSGGWDTNLTAPELGANDNLTYIMKGQFLGMGEYSTVFGNRYGGASDFNWIKFENRRFDFRENIELDYSSHLSVGDHFEKVAVKRGSDFFLYEYGILKTTASSLNTIGWNPIYIGTGSTSNDESVDAIFDYCLVTLQALTESHAAFLNTHPHYLLQPVPRTIYFDYGAGGAITAFVSDGISLSDTSSRTATFRPQVQDGIQLGDSDTNLASFFAQLSDGVTLSDESTASIVSSVISAEVVDGITLSDTSRVTASLTAEAQDGVKLSETIAATLQAVALAQDGVALSDSTTLGSAILSALAEDGITLSDTASRTLRKFAQAADSITLSDAGAAQANFTAECRDIAEFGATISAIMQFAASCHDGVQFSDSTMEVSTLPTGEVQITFTARSARLTFTARSARLTFTVRAPNIKFQ